MKKKTTHVLFCILALIICLSISLLFGHMLFVYTVPMQDAFYDLSMFFDGEAIPEDWQYDQKGWQVFLQEGEQITPLMANGTGGFTGLKKPGQTYYCARIMAETLDSPTLRLNTANQSVAVFLDEELLYTDNPELDNRIGHLTLPMLDWDRTEPLVLSLPLHYQGKTLTIAHSSGLGEKQAPEADLTVWPCMMHLYCGYSYESGLISESFRTAIPAALCFGTGVLLLAVFLWQLFTGKTDRSLLFLALTAFLWSAWQLSTSSFSGVYFGEIPADVSLLTRLLSVTALLLFLTSRLTGKLRLPFGILTALQGAAVLLFVVPCIDNTPGILWLNVSEWIGCGELLGILICMGWEWRRGNLFYRLFCPLTLTGMAAFPVRLLAVPSLRQEFVQQLSLGSQAYFLWKLMWLMLPTAILSAFLEWLSQEIDRRSATKFLMQQYELAQSGFENLRRHQEEVMILRHDMTKHLLFLQKSTTDKATSDYLEELIGQQQALSPVVQSQNRKLDIILNAKLGEAAEHGIAVEIIQADAPEALPLSDAELCALIMNLLDNAIHAACKAENPLLRLDLHQKNGFFVFVCENAVSSSDIQKEVQKKETVSEHGHGLRIIEQIIGKYGNLMEVTRSSGFYRVTIALPLHFTPPPPHANSAEGFL